MYSFKKIHFEISERKLMLRLVDMILLFAVMWYVGDTFSIKYFQRTTTFFPYPFTFLFYYQCFATVFEMYQLQVASSHFRVFKSTLLTSVFTVVAYLFTPVFAPALPYQRIHILLFFGIVLLVLIFWRMFYVAFMASNRFSQKVILIGEKAHFQEVIDEFGKQDPHFQVVGFVDIENPSTYLSLEGDMIYLSWHNLGMSVKELGVTEIVMTSQKTEALNSDLYHQLLQLLASGISIREYNQVFEDKAMRIPVHHLGKDFFQYFPFSRNNRNKLYLYGTRFLEILLAVIGLFFFGLLLPIIFIGNLIGNRGPLFFKQERVGLYGKSFYIYKLRSMVTDAEKNGAVFATANDTRITKFGKFLRKSRLDEVPQFINILKGDMAIIGPRPERPVFVEKITEMMPFYETRHVVKPGITGWAQVCHTYGETLEDSLVKLQYDLYYIKHRSIFLDLDIVLKTISTVLFYRGQ